MAAKQPPKNVKVLAILRLLYLYMAIGIYVKLQNVLIAVLCLEKNSQDKERIYYLFYELKNVRKKIKKSVNEILQ